MNTYISRQPVMNKKIQLCGYRLVMDRKQAAGLLENPDGQPDPDGFARALAELSDQTMPYIDWMPELSDGRLPALSYREGQPGTVVVLGKNAGVTAAQCRSLREKGFRLAADSAYVTQGSPVAEAADLIAVDFPMVSLASQKELIRKMKHRVMFLADRIETWEDFRVAKDLGYDLFRGYFFLWPEPGLQQKDIKSLDACLINVLAELDTPEPSFKKIAVLIEHDLGLSYRLLRLVNSASMAPKYEITSIAHALAYLGTRELHQWVSMLLMGGIKSSENSELVKMSLIRGKLTALCARELQIADAGSEPFFIGLFSLIDVILDKDMHDLLTGLPLSNSVKSALRGESGELSRLLSFVVDYEQAQWQRIEGKYPLDRIGEETMVSLYRQAHQWATLLN